MSILFPRRKSGRAPKPPDTPVPAPAYAELAVTTNFSFLRGASHPWDLVKQAKLLGLTGIGIADRNSRRRRGARARASEGAE